jgi:hypothetical protein
MSFLTIRGRDFWTPWRKPQQARTKHDKWKTIARLTAARSGAGAALSKAKITDALWFTETCIARTTSDAGGGPSL